MKFQELETAYQQYKADPSSAHELFQLCLETARQQLSIHAWGQDFSREDVAQEATIAAWLAIPTLKPAVCFPVVFLGIIRNKLNDELRRRYRVREGSLRDADVYSNEDERLLDHIRIPQTPLTQRMLDGHSLAGAAQQLGISKDAARRQLFALGGKK